MTRVRAERLVTGGDALGRLDDGRIVFVPLALPGEEVDIEIVDDRRDFARGRLAEVVAPSADRVDPPCPHRHAGCGGCGWMHLRPSAQLDAKVGIVAEALRRTGGLDTTTIDGIVESGAAVGPVGERTTIRVVGVDDGVGFREAGSSDVVPVDECQVAHPRLSALLPDLRIQPGVELTLRTSVATEAITAFWSRPESRGRRRRGRSGGPRGGAVRMVDGLPAGVHIGPLAFLDERIAGVDLRVSAPSFFQSSPAAADLLVATVADLAPEAVGARHLVDAYGGVGLFASTVGRSARHVTLIESAPSSIADATHNLADRDDTATVVRSEVGRWEPEGRHAPPIGEPGPGPVDVVVADPARSGLGRPGVQSLTATAAATFVLVSCDPVSLARDTRLLGEAGYRPERVVVLDLFPQTPHVETVTRFTR